MNALKQIMENKTIEIQLVYNEYVKSQLNSQSNPILACGRILETKVN